jgi:predicted acetyltransferase
MLRAVLPMARQLGISSALVTCDADNGGSRKTIEHNGGVLDDEHDGKLRFWVPTAAAAVSRR